MLKAAEGYQLRWLLGITSEERYFCCLQVLLTVFPWGHQVGLCEDRRLVYMGSLCLDSAAAGLL